jgi:hypothetical protein
MRKCAVHVRENWQLIARPGLNQWGTGTVRDTMV